MIRMKVSVALAALLFLSLPLNHARAWNLYSANIANQELHVNFGGGWAFFQPDDINERNDLIANKKIEDGPNLRLGIAKFISPRLSAGLGFQYVTSGFDYEADGEFAQMNYSASLRVVAAEFQIRYYFPLAHVDYFVTGNQSICFARYNNKADYYNQSLPPLSYDWDDKYHGFGVVLSATAGVRKEFDRKLGLDIEIGYRYLATGSLKGETTSVYASPSYLSPILDLSGPYVIAGISRRIH